MSPPPPLPSSPLPPLPRPPWQMSNTATLSTSYGVPLMVYVSVTNTSGAVVVRNATQRLTAVVGTAGGDVIKILGRNFGALLSKINVTWDGVPLEQGLVDLVAPHYELSVKSLPGASIGGGVGECSRLLFVSIVCSPLGRRFMRWCARRAIHAVLKQRSMLPHPLLRDVTDVCSSMPPPLSRPLCMCR